MIDEADLELVSRFTWSLSDKGYVVAGEWLSDQGRVRHWHLGRYLLGLEHGDRRQADHRDRNPLNNRRSNLRIATVAQNAQNRAHSDHRGVDRRTTGKWRARVHVDKRWLSLGQYATREEAAAVASAWRREHMPFSEADRAA